MIDEDRFDDPHLFDDGNGPGPEIGQQVAPCPRCGTLIDEHRRDAEVGVEHTERICAAIFRVRALSGYGPSDPRTLCPGCGYRALDGKMTCGDVRCGSSTGRDRMR